MVIKKIVLSERLKISQDEHIPASALVERTKPWSFCKFPSLYQKVDTQTNHNVRTIEVKVVLEKLLFVHTCYPPCWPIHQHRSLPNSLTLPLSSTH